MESEHRRVLIIGSGPAGYTAAIYMARAGLEPLMLAGLNFGGQLMITTDVENYPGYPEGVTGPLMMEEFQKQAERFGTEILFEDATEVSFESRPFGVSTAKKEYTAEFKEQSVRFVFEHIEVDESRYGACQRLGSKLNVKSVTLYHWVKISTPKPVKPASASGSVEELKAQLAEVRKENRELARANQPILHDAAVFIGEALDRRSKK